MARKPRTPKPKFTVDAEVKNELVKLLFGGALTPEVAEKLLTKNWAETLFDWFKNEVEQEKPAEVPVVTKNVKYKQAYEKLANQVTKMNELVIKITEETKE